MPRTIPSQDRYQRQWGQLSFSERRDILRAVNSGQAVEDPDDAGLAVVTAGRQESFWEKIWLLGPLMGLLFVQQSWVAVAVNAALATAVLGAMSWWRLRRVRRAETRNRAVVRGVDPADANDGVTSPPGSRRGDRGHTPHRGGHRRLPPDAKSVRPGAGEPKRSRRRRRGG